MTERAAEQLGAGPPPRRRRVREFVGHRSTTQRFGALGLLAVLVTVPFGGMRSVGDADTEPLRLGQRIDIGPFYVTLDKVSQVGDLQPAISPDEPGLRLMVLKLEVTNHSDRPEQVNLVRDAIGAEHSGLVRWSLNPEDPLKVFNVEDAVEYAEDVNPGQTYTVAMVFQQDPATDVDAVTFNISGYYFREIDPGTLEPNTWVLQDPPLVEGHVPVVVQE